MSVPPPDKRDPVSQILGPTGPGPFALLDLPTEDVTIQRVLSALHVRLEQVNASARAATPAAEDVRLALHAAAAQLCDPAVRRLLIGSWSNGGRMLEAPLDEPIEDVRVAIERDLHIAVGLSGGWNAAAMQRLALACEVRGIGLQDVGAVLAGIGSRGPEKPRSASGERPLRVEARPSSGVPRELILALGIGVAAVVLMVVGLVMLTAPRGAEATARDVVAVLEGGVPTAPLVMEERREAAIPRASDLAIGDARAIGREFASLAAAMSREAATDASTRERFERAFEAYATNWHLLRRDETTAIVSSLIDLAFAAVQRQRESELVVMIVEPLGGVPRDRRGVRALVAAGALAARLMQERDLPRGMRAQLEAALRSNDATRDLGPANGVEDAAAQIVLPLASALAIGSSWSDAGVWRGFVDVRDAALGDRTRLKDAASLVALQGVMSKDVGVGAGSGEEAVAVIAGSLSWTKSPELRAAVLGWFDDERVSMPRLAALTRAMVKSAVRGVDSTMALAPSAMAERRRELRGQLDTALRDESAGVGAESVRAWMAAAESLLMRTASSPPELIDLAARLSELAAARAAQMEGHSEAATVLIASAGTASTLPPDATARELPVVDWGSKAIEYVSLGVSQAARTEFWRKRLAEGTRPDVLLARAAIEEAARGSPPTVRDAARDYVRAKANDDAIVLAALDAVFSIPETPENLDWLSDVAGKKIAWRGRGQSREAVHRDLLAAAASRFGTWAGGEAIDLAAERLASSWMARLREGEDGEDGTIVPPPTEAVRRLAMQRLAVQGGAQGVEGEVRRRLGARLALARGIVQEAVWWQAATVELLSAAVLKRSPSVRGRELLDEWNVRRRRAMTSYEQILEGERAVVLLLRAEAEALLAAGGGA